MILALYRSSCTNRQCRCMLGKPLSPTAARWNLTSANSVSSRSRPTTNWSSTFVFTRGRSPTNVHTATAASSNLAMCSNIPDFTPVSTGGLAINSGTDKLQQSFIIKDALLIAQRLRKRGLINWLFVGSYIILNWYKKHCPYLWKCAQCNLKIIQKLSRCDSDNLWVQMLSWGIANISGSDKVKL